MKSNLFEFKKLTKRILQPKRRQPSSNFSLYFDCKISCIIRTSKVLPPLSLKLLDISNCFGIRGCIFSFYHPLLFSCTYRRQNAFLCLTDILLKFFILLYFCKKILSVSRKRNVQATIFVICIITA